jgi:hypothetical protein
LDIPAALAASYSVALDARAPEPGPNLCDFGHLPIVTFVITRRMMIADVAMTG